MIFKLPTMGNTDHPCVVDKCRAVGQYVNQTTTTEMTSPTTSLLSDSVALLCQEMDFILFQTRPLQDELGSVDINFT